MVNLIKIMNIKREIKEEDMTDDMSVSELINSHMKFLESINAKTSTISYEYEDCILKIQIIKKL